MEGKINQAMANVYKKTGAIAKEQKNSQQGFMFRGIDDVYNTLHAIFAEEGIFVLPEKLSSTRDEIESKSGTKGFVTVQTIKFNFVADDGSSVYAIVDGEGADYGDKSTSKSQSMAIKYALLQVFMIPTIDMVDGDRYTMDDMAPEYYKELESLKSANTIDEIKSALHILSKYKNDKAKMAEITKIRDEKKGEAK